MIKLRHHLIIACALGLSVTGVFAAWTFGSFQTTDTQTDVDIAEVLPADRWSFKTTQVTFDCGSNGYFSNPEETRKTFTVNDGQALPQSIINQINNPTSKVAGLYFSHWEDSNGNRYIYDVSINDVTTYTAVFKSVSACHYALYEFNESHESTKYANATPIAILDVNKGAIPTPSADISNNSNSTYRIVGQGGFLHMANETTTWNTTSDTKYILKAGYESNKGTLFNVPFFNGDKFKVFSPNNNWYNNVTSTSAYYSKDNNDANIIITKTGYYDVYFNSYDQIHLEYKGVIEYMANNVRTLNDNTRYVISDNVTIYDIDTDDIEKGLHNVYFRPENGIDNISSLPSWSAFGGYTHFQRIFRYVLLGGESSNGVDYDLLTQEEKDNLLSLGYSSEDSDYKYYCAYNIDLSSNNKFIVYETEFADDLTVKDGVVTNSWTLDTTNATLNGTYVTAKNPNISHTVKLGVKMPVDDGENIYKTITNSKVFLEKTKYSVRFYSENNVNYTEVLVSSGDKIDVNQVPKIDSYITDWVDRDTEDFIDVYNSPITENLFLKPITRTTLATVEVELKLGDSGNHALYKIRKNGTLPYYVEPTNPAPSQYTFKGWNVNNAIDLDGSDYSTIDTSMTFNSDKTYYAMFEAPALFYGGSQYYYGDSSWTINGVGSLKNAVAIIYNYYLKRYSTTSSSLNVNYKTRFTINLNGTTLSSTSLLYLDCGGMYNSSEAYPAAYFFGNGNTWIKMTEHDGDIYKVEVPQGYTSVIFCRMNKSTSGLNWDNKWNQTEDISLGTTYNCYLITEWVNGGKEKAEPSTYNLPSISATLIRPS